MAVRNSNTKPKGYDPFFNLPESALIDVVATRGDVVIVKQMTWGEAYRMKKSKGWKYENFQPNYHTYKSTQ